jgi:protein ImuB
VRLWLCLRLTDLALQCLPQRRAGVAVVVVDGQRLAAVDATASLLGIEPGMDLRSARTLVGDDPLQALERDRDAEARALESLCHWAYGVTPELRPWRGDSLLLEISGSLRLFGGIDTILDHCDHGLACRGFSADKGLAATPLAAWLLSHDAADVALDTRTALEARLAAVPLARLGALHEGSDALQRSGLRTLGEALALPPAALRRRLGDTFAKILASLMDEREEAAARYRPPARFIDHCPLGYPVEDWQELEPALHTLLQSLQAFLRQRQLQTRSLHWHFIGHGSYRETLSLHANRDDNRWQDWLRLTRLRLERLAFREAVEIVQLRCDEIEATRTHSGDLFADPGQREPRERILDVLGTRLGPQCVRGLHCRDAHLPEQASASLPGPPPDRQPATAAAAQRPFWLLPRPEPLRGDDGRLRYWGSPLQLLYGPERIEDGWWDTPTSRDYYVARNPQGERFWVFFERRQQRWFLQGIFT